MTSGMVSKVSQMWARNQRCKFPMRQSTTFLRTPINAAKTKIDNEIAPKIRPSGVPPTLRRSEGFWTNGSGNRNPAGKFSGAKLPM